ncbi:biopolymer transporter ExbD [Roseibium sp.]|uniref:biopolymer transporter ExbD n=1 Tax=Roseibium sp. TaxID=1936156 RepID=UPI003B52A651
MKRFSKPIHLPELIKGPKRDSSLALINVVFLLLVFLLVSGTLRPPLPNEFDWAETTSDNGGGTLQGSLVLDRTGGIWLGAEKLSDPEIDKLLADLAVGGGKLSLQVDRRAQMSSVSAVAKRAKEFGLKTLSLITVEAAGQ